MDYPRASDPAVPQPVRIPEGALYEDASALGLRPGDWPHVIHYGGVMYLRGWQIRNGPDRELSAVIYVGIEAKDAPALCVLND